jgi:hypothetical protein
LLAENGLYQSKKLNNKATFSRLAVEKNFHYAPAAKKAQKTSSFLHKMQLDLNLLLNNSYALLLLFII